MAFQNPRANLDHLHLREGEHVVDFGAGSGAYTLPVAARVGEHGRVYAVDVQKDLLARLEAEAAAAGIKNIAVVWGNFEQAGGTTLADGIADLVLIANAFFQSENQYVTALEAKRLLRPGGRVALIDWSDSFGGLGPAPANVVTPEQAIAVFEHAGFRVAERFAAGDHHYGLLFVPQS